MYNGNGHITRKDTPRTDIEIWTGRFISAQGRNMVLMATANRELGYEVQVKDTSTKPWPVVTIFKFKPFGKMDTQKINVPLLGQLMIERVGAIRDNMNNVIKPARINFNLMAI